MQGVLKNLVRVGQVSSVNPKNLTVRVVFEAQGTVSYELPVLQSQTLRNKDYCLPDVGERVVCLFLPTGNATGFVLGSLYTTAVEPPANSEDKRLIQFEDGTRIEYDRAQHELTIHCVGAVTINADADVTIIGDVIADGISLKQHIHPQSDGGFTGEPQP